MKAGLKIVEDSRTLRLECSGVWRAATLGEIPRQLLGMRSGKRVAVSLSGITQMDTTAAVMLLALRRRLEASGAEVRFEGADATAQRLFETVGASAHPGASFQSRAEGTIEGIGRVVTEAA